MKSYSLRQLTLTLTTLALLSTSSLMATDAELAIEENVVSSLMTRVSELEDENRTLTGALEETQHLTRELQNRLETALSDVEMRLNALEGHGAAAGSSSIAPTPAEAALGKEEMPLPLGETAPKDASGNVMGSLGSKDAPKGTAAAGDKSDSAENQYEKALALLEKGDYEAAEKAFAAFVKAHPKDKLAGKAQYWLGVTFYVRGNYEQAAAAFAKGYKTYVKSEKAPDMLFKLAKSLEAMDRKSDACKALAEMQSSHPKSQKAEVAKLVKSLSCKS